MPESSSNPNQLYPRERGTQQPELTEKSPIFSIPVLTNGRKEERMFQVTLLELCHRFPRRHDDATPKGPREQRSPQGFVK